MPKRVTKSMLEEKVKNIDDMSNHFYRHIGTFNLDHDMTGYQLVEMLKNGGQNTVVPRCSAREMWYALVGLGEGLQRAKK